MTQKEKLERLRSLESMADDCVHEIATLLGDEDIRNIWARISDKVQLRIASLNAIITFMDSAKDLGDDE